MSDSLQLLCPWNFPDKKSWNGLPFPTPGDLPDPDWTFTSYVSCIGRWVLHHSHHLGSPIRKIHCANSPERYLLASFFKMKPMYIYMIIKVEKIWKKEKNYYKATTLTQLFSMMCFSPLVFLIHWWGCF